MFLHNYKFIYDFLKKSLGLSIATFLKQGLGLHKKKYKSGTRFIDLKLWCIYNAINLNRRKDGFWVKVVGSNWPNDSRAAGTNNTLLNIFVFILHVNTARSKAIPEYYNQMNSSSVVLPLCLFCPALSYSLTKRPRFTRLPLRRSKNDLK